MAVYASILKTTGEIIAMSEVHNSQAARAATAAELIEVRVATVDEILKWGEEKKGLTAPRKKGTRTPPADPNQINRLDEAKESEPAKGEDAQA